MVASASLPTHQPYHANAGLSTSNDMRPTHVYVAFNAWLGGCFASALRPSRPGAPWWCSDTTSPRTGPHHDRATRPTTSPPPPPPCVRVPCLSRRSTRLGSRAREGACRNAGIRARNQEDPCRAQNTWGIGWAARGTGPFSGDAGHGSRHFLTRRKEGTQYISTPLYLVRWSTLCYSARPTGPLATGRGYQRHWDVTRVAEDTAATG